MPPEVPVEKTGIKILPLVAILIVLLLSGGAAAYVIQKSPLPRPAAQPQNSESAANIANIKFTVPMGWVETTVDPRMLPEGFTHPINSFKKSGTACLISQATESDGPFVHKQISWADRVFSRRSQYDGSWYVASTSSNSGLLFSGYTRQHLPGEFRVSYNFREEPFLLFMEDGTSVPDHCNGDLNQLLESIEPHFEHIQLTESSRGTVRFNRVWNDRSVTNGSYQNILFTPDGSRSNFEIMKIPGFDISDLYVTGNLIYAVGIIGDPFSPASSSIYEIDIFAGTAREVPGTHLDKGYISTLYLRAGMLYYIAGHPEEGGKCANIYAPCVRDLYKIPSSGGTPVLITQTKKGGGILGFSTQENALFIESGTGDAGCWNVYASKIKDGVEELIGRYGGCDGDAEDMAQQAALKAIEAKVDAIPRSPVINVMNGKLEPSNNVESDYPINWAS